jgi:hypothetical protein
MGNLIKSVKKSFTIGKKIRKNIFVKSRHLREKIVIAAALALSF